MYTRVWCAEKMAPEKTALGIKGPGKNGPGKKGPLGRKKRPLYLVTSLQEFKLIQNGRRKIVSVIWPSQAHIDSFSRRNLRFCENYFKR